MNNFWTRLITGILLIVIITSSVFTGSTNFILLVLFINVLALREFYMLFASYSPFRWFGFLSSVLLFVSSILVIKGVTGLWFFVLNIPLAFAVLLNGLYKNSLQPFVSLAITYFGIIYITVPSVFLLALAFIPLHREYDPWTVMGLFLIVWAHDSGAYAVGKLFGKHPLFKRVSPNKTWEGSVGGVCGALGVALFLSYHYPALSKIHWWAVALIIIVFGTYGDLIKSVLKRSCHVKDSGTILPGHGGILDRFDSILGAAPFIFCYVFIVENNLVL